MAWNYKEDYDSLINKKMRSALGMDDNGHYIHDPTQYNGDKVKEYSQKIKTDPTANAATRALGKRTRLGVIKEIYKDGYKFRNTQDPIEQLNQSNELTRQQQEMDKHQRVFDDGLKKLGWDYKKDDNVRNAMNTFAAATSRDQFGDSIYSGNNLDSPKNLKLYSDVNKMNFGGNGNAGPAPASAEW